MKIVINTNELSAKIIASILHDAGYFEIANTIKAQLPITPARIHEPEPGKHVTARVHPTTACIHPDQPETFLRLRLQKLRNEDPYDWACLATGHVYKWTSLIDPRRLEGLS